MASDLSLGADSQPTSENATRLSGSISRRVLVGSFVGLAWGASLRAWMVSLALEVGDQPHITWSGTFGGVLLPTALVGALLGAAVHDAETSPCKRWRWVILAPLLLIIGPVVVIKDFFNILITTGMGGGSIGVALIGMLGGYAFSGFGARWTRWASGFLTVALSLGLIVPVYLGGQSESSTPGTGKVFGALLFVLLMVLLVVGVSTPSKMARGRMP